MAEILTRTYTYTGQSGWKSGESAVKLSSFAVTGDKRPITQILSISASWYRYHDTSSTVVHAAELVFSGGTTLKSNGVTQRKDQGIFKIESSFMDMPGASTWKEANITLRTTLSTKLTSVYWRATAAQPMVLTITYTSSEFKPYITNAKLYRANSLGAAADDGTYLSFKATLALEKLGNDGSGSGTFTIYSGDSAASTTTEVYSSSVSGSTSGVTVSAAPISGVRIGSGVKKWFRMEFAYTAKTESDVSSTETVSTTFLIGNVFTNVHLAGKKKGGVAFGKYSASTDDTPMFECNYPAYFYGGIAQIGNAWTKLTPTTGTTPGDYGGGALRCRAIGDKRIVEGSINVQPGSDTIVLATLPSGYTPAKAVYSINACSGSRVARIAVGGIGETNAGKLCLSWVKNLADGTSYTGAAIWVQCSIEYWV